MQYRSLCFCALPLGRCSQFLYEGEEEIMSPYLSAFLDKHGPAGSKLLAADLALSADGGQPAADQGGISLGLRYVHCGVRLTLNQVLPRCNLRWPISVEWS